MRGVKGVKDIQICQIMFSLQGKFDEMKRDGLTEEKLYERHVLNIIKTVTDGL